MDRKYTGIARWTKRGLLAAEVLVLLPIVILLVTNQVIRISADSQLYDAVGDIPYSKVGLVLGTSHRVRNGGPNPYFHNRMEAAATLYHHGKISYLIASGDNRSIYYNEPEQMRQALIRLGVPDEVIYPDQAGLRTLDSVIRAKEVFGQTKLTIISQRFHNQRAVYIANRHGMEVYAFNAEDVPPAKTDRTVVREWFAKANVFWDLLTNKQPLHLGEIIPIGDPAN